MARLILLVASGTLLLCQTLATFSTTGEDDDGSSSGSIVQEEKRFVRNVDPTALHSWPAGPEQQGAWNQQHSTPCQTPGCQAAGSHPSHDPYHQQTQLVQPQPGAYIGYQPAPAVQPQYEPYTGYQPFPGAQPHAEQYPGVQPYPAVQPQAESYPGYQHYPAVQPQAESYAGYQPYPAVQPQAESYPFYQPAPVGQHQAVYQPAPAIQHQSVYQPAPGHQHSSYHPYPHNTSPVPGQPTSMVRYIPGVVIRKYSCRQRVDCGWTYVTTQGRYITIRIPEQRPIIYTCHRPYCNPVHTTCYNPSPVIYQPRQYPPIQPYHTCSGHSQCGPSQQCCYGATSAHMGCYPGAAVALRSQRHLQFNSTVTTRSLVELVIGDWRNSNVTSFVTDLLLPLKVDLEHDIEVILLTDPKQNGGPCGVQDTDCIGPRILSCVAEMWPSVIQLLADAGSAPNNTPFLPSPPWSPMAEQPEEGLEEPLANATTDLSNHLDDDSRSFDEPSVSGDEPLEVFMVDPVASAADARQVKLLSFAACLLQSFGSGVVERKKTALLAAKRCVRANKLNWPRVRACVAPRGHGGARGGWRPDPSHTRPTEIIVNGEPAPHQDNLKLALCQALLKAGQTPLLCDLLYDELDQRQEEQSIANTEEGSTDTISYEDQDSPSMRHTDYHGPGRAWSDQGLGFSQGLPRNQTQDGADKGQKFFRIQEAYGAEDAHGAMEAYGPQEAYGTQEAYRTQESYGMENQRGPEESKDQNVGFSMSRVSQSLDEVPASSTIWTGGVGNPYEV